MIQFLVPSFYNNRITSLSCDSVMEDTPITKAFNGDYGFCYFNASAGVIDIGLTLTTNSGVAYAYIQDMSPSSALVMDVGTATALGGGLYSLTGSTNDLSFGFTIVNSGVVAIRNIIFSNSFSVPQYNQDYSVKISYPNNTFSNFSGKELINFPITSSLVEEKIVDYAWAGLTGAEKDVFVSFINAFHNSYKPFIFIDGISGEVFNYIIISDSITINLDDLNLWSVSFSVRDLSDNSVANLPTPPTPPPPSLPYYWNQGWGFGWSGNT